MTVGGLKAMRGFHLNGSKKFPSLYQTHKIRSSGNPNKGSGGKVKRRSIRISKAKPHARR